MAAVAGILRLRLMFRSLTASLQPGRRRGIRSSHRGKVGIPEAIRGMADIRSRFGRHRDMGRGTRQGTDLEIGPDMDMGRRVRSRVRSIRCGLRRRLGICRSGWRSTSTCRWISRSICFGRSRVLTG